MRYPDRDAYLSLIKRLNHDLIASRAGQAESHQGGRSLLGAVKRRLIGNNRERKA